jgi:protein FAM50
VKKKRKGNASARGKLSFAFDDEDEDSASVPSAAMTPRSKSGTPDIRRPADAGNDTNVDGTEDVALNPPVRRKLGPNTSLTTPAPKAMTKSAMARDAATREQLRKEYLAMQETVKNTEIMIPFVFYDGSSIPGGSVRVKKGDHVWLFLDKARKVGAELGVGGNERNSKGGWARVGVDDLMLVRGSLIVPHHYQFYHFILNKVELAGTKVFGYSDQPTKSSAAASASAQPDADLSTYDPLARTSTKSAGSNIPDSDLEGFNDDANITRVVDRRWYERNKHIYPASIWEEFDPGKDYSKGTRKDTEGNSFFFS